MAKLKLSLPSGSEVEKTVISYFKNNEKNYLILDAESVGSMGLPIILVCKVLEDRVVKITDQNEWQQVKSYLKTIISGGKMDYINVPQNLPADEVYYTQLTLPVASFDILKNSYVVENNTSDVMIENNTQDVNQFISSTEETIGEQPINMSTNVVNEIPIESEIINPINNDLNDPIVNEMIAPINSGIGETTVEEPEVSISNNGIDMTEPMINEGLIPSQGLEAATIIQEPVIAEPIVLNEPVIENNFIESEPVVNNNPITENNTMSVTEPLEMVNENKMDFSDCKTLFMQACENMFDALAAKIEAELKSK